jgi:phosphodiesterase/alkaline phosphatase D-like protein
MRRIFKVLALAFVVIGCIPAAALGASPVATTQGSTRVSNTGVVLHGRVNPNGIETSYLFQYGPTPDLGIESSAHAIGSGNSGVEVARALGGLTPGTVYYYRIQASSAAGIAQGAILHFTTTGPPPPLVVTGTALNVRKTQATPTGLINANGGATTWQMQYGLTTAYGMETTVTPLTPLTSTPLPVSAQLTGLSPATLFHYRVVAFHLTGPTQYGLDGTFFTQPDHRPTPRFTTKTTPGSDRKSPYQFMTTGTLSGASFIPAIDRCTGKVGVRYYAGKRQVAVVVSPVGGDCKFTAQTSFKHTHVKGTTRLRVTISFRGNGYIAGVNRVNHVKAG